MGSPKTTCICQESRNNPAGSGHQHHAGAAASRPPLNCHQKGRVRGTPDFRLTLARESLPALLEGLKITVELTFIVIAISLVLGIFVALGRLSKNRVLSTVTGFYVDFMRATPLLLQLIYIYFVLPTIGIRLDPFVAAVVGLSLNYSAYLSEVYRSGIQAIPRGQLDAAAALGMRPSLTMRRIVLPQAIRIVIPTAGELLRRTVQGHVIGLCADPARTALQRPNHHFQDL